jgi:hypothetical protein
MRNIKIYEIILISVISCFPLLSFSAEPDGKACFQKSEYFNVLDRDVIPNEEVAKNIAEVILIPIYGAIAIERQKPFSVALEDDVWTVTGYLSKNMLGGTFSILISKRDGRIVKIIHEK